MVLFQHGILLSSADFWFILQYLWDVTGSVILMIRLLKVFCPNYDNNKIFQNGIKTNGLDIGQKQSCVLAHQLHDDNIDDHMIVGLTNKMHWWKEAPASYKLYEKHILKQMNSKTFPFIIRYN